MTPVQATCAPFRHAQTQTSNSADHRVCRRREHSYTSNRHPCYVLLY